MNTWVVEVKHDKETNDHFIELNDEIVELSGFKEGDTIKWVDNLDGSYTILKTSMDDYVITDEFKNSELNREAIIFFSKDKAHHIVDMYEDNALVHSRKIENHRYSYVEDYAINWVSAYGEFKK